MQNSPNALNVSIGGYTYMHSNNIKMCKNYIHNSQIEFFKDIIFLYITPVMHNHFWLNSSC